MLIMGLKPRGWYVPYPCNLCYIPNNPCSTGGEKDGVISVVQETVINCRERKKAIGCEERK